MAGVKLSFTLQDEQARSHLAGLVEAGRDMSPLMAEIGILLEGSAKRRINDTNVAPDGVPWPTSFRVQDNGGKTLRNSGVLENSITFVSGGDFAEIGTNLPYAGIHQEGGDIVPKNGNALQFNIPGVGLVTVGKVTIPARPYLGVSDDDAIEINGLTAKHFGGDLRT